MIRLTAELAQYRGLLWSLTLRELKSRYRGSALGFLWTFLNPLLQMLVYVVVFRIYSRLDIPNYAYFMLVGLLPWIWFSSSLGGGISAITDRRDLITKVRFPPQVLPATVVATNLVNYLLSLPLMLGLGLMFGHLPSVHVLALPLVMLVQLAFVCSLTFLLAALNVFFRDLQHIVGNVTMLWFFVTPVLYRVTDIPESMRQFQLAANPMSGVIAGYQAIFYEHAFPRLQLLLPAAATSLVAALIAGVVYARRREEFAELA